MLQGCPWESGNEYGLHGRSMLLHMLKLANAHGWYLVASLDVSAKYVHRQKAPDYPIDVHSWYFTTDTGWPAPTVQQAPSAPPMPAKMPSPTPAPMAAPMVPPHATGPYMPSVSSPPPSYDDVMASAAASAPVLQPEPELDAKAQQNFETEGPWIRRNEYKY